MTLNDLQKKLKKFKLDGFLVSHNNFFINQDIRADENIIQYLTGFSGSAGTLLIRPLPEKNILFVDGRYELQAPQQTNSKEVEVICTKDISLIDWINLHFAHKTLGYNDWCWSINELEHLTTPKLKGDITFLPAAMTEETGRIFEHDLSYCGISREEKISHIAAYLTQNNLQGYFISAADSVSWLLNLRSDLLPETPIFRAYALIDEKCHVWIFTNNANLQNPPVKLTILPLEQLPFRLKKFKNKNLGCDFNTTPVAIMALAKQMNIRLINQPDDCQQQKSIKNECELKGIRQAHIRDGIAICKFLYWLEQNWHNKTELDIVAKLHEYRAKQKNYVSESFSTIAAAGANGAIVHYVPTSNTNTPLTANTLLLIDSGAQYYDGTTDITRTIALGHISPQMSDDFTLVLKSHIALSSAVFPLNTTGDKLDTIARLPFWKEGKTYHHGTGHGVGCFLNVHEGPTFISPSCRQPLKAGQITSIEPGLYLENKYGIRIENLVEVTPAAQQGFLQFKNLTLVPIDLRALNKYLLSEDEISWLNNYHQQVYKTIAPHLTPDEKNWLKQACSPL